MIFLNKEVIEKNKKSFKCSLKVKSKIEEVKTDNIYAFIPGKEIPDSFIVFTAHYDHLGNIDTTYFPGANDNSSGVAMLLDLMRYYKNNPTKYSVAFFFFTGEEIGLLGSKYYVEHPLFDLNRIKVLINLDLMGGGSEGIMVVNGKIFQDDFNTLKKINDEKGYNISIHSRGKAQNSDHYWFTEKGVKSFFIYTMGDIKAYHDIYDKANKLTFTNYETIFKLLIEWVKM
jgi:Zn-dependent M28 family amino/carboxypeptidase